eukprot:scaffold187589_cov37-Tisochrysis_lutea.AAC.2
MPCLTALPYAMVVAVAASAANGVYECERLGRRRMDKQGGTARADFLGWARWASSPINRH